MEIKRAEQKDTASISRIHARSWKAAYKGIVPQSYLDDLKEDFWVAAFDTWLNDHVLTAAIIWDGERPAGCVAYGKARDEHMHGWGEIVSIYCLPEYFGKGFGAPLLQYALQDMRRAGFQSVYLWVLEENLRAQRFYSKHGFAKTSDCILCTISGKDLVDIRFVYDSALSASTQSRNFD